MTDKQTQQVFHPDPALYKKWLGGSLGRTVLGATSPIAIVLWMVALHPQNFLAVIIATIVTIAIVYPIAMLFIRSPKTRIVVNADQIDFYGVLGRKRVLLLSDPIDGILSQYHQADTFISFDSAGTPLLLIRDKKTGRRFKLWGSHWNIDDLVKIAEAAHVEVKQFSSEEVASINQLEKRQIPGNEARTIILEDAHPKDIQKKHPGLVRFPELHPNAFALSIVGAFCLAMFIVFLFTSQSQPL